MAKDVIITPASGTVDFYGTSGGSVLANINLTDNNDFSLSATSGNLIIGDASRDVYIGDGINEVDIVFEQNGEIRSVANKYITISAGQVNATGVAVNTSSPNAIMHVYGSTPSGTVLNVEGTNGSLFSVVDNLDGTLMSVNNNAGLPVLEVFSDDSVVAGRFGQNDFVVSSSGNIGIGTNSPSNNLHVVGSALITSELLVDDKIKHSNGSFASSGDAQHIVMVARRTTSDATANQVLFLNGSSQRLTIPVATMWTFEVKLSAYNDTEHEAAWWIFRGGIINREAGEVELLGSVISESFSEMQGISASVVADDTNDALEIRVTGATGKDIRWVAVVDISQVSFGTP